jgi:predicted MFS family arabinose efflux permease
MKVEENAAAAGTNAPSRLTRPEWGLLLVLAAVQFTHIMDFVIMMPLGPEFATALDLSTAEFGWLVSVYGFSASLSGLLAAWFLDRFDRKQALLFLYAGFTAGTLLCAAAPGYALLLVARAVAGGFAGVMAANVLAVVGDVFPESRRGTAMGVVMSAFSLASIAGVPSGLFLANQFGWRTPFAALGVLSVAVLALAWYLLPPLRGHLARGPARPVSTWEVMTHPTHLRAYALMVVLVLSTFTIIPYLSLYLVNNVGLLKEELPYVWLCGGLATLLTMTPVGRLSDRFGKLRVFRTVALFTLLPTLLLTNLPAVGLVVALLATTLFMVATAGRMVPAMAMITASALPRYRGSFMSINASVQQMAAGLAPLVSGALLKETENGAPLEGFRVVGLLAATVMVCSVILAGRLRPADAGLAAPAAAEPPVEPPAPTDPAAETQAA